MRGVNAPSPKVCHNPDFCGLIALWRGGGWPDLLHVRCTTHTHRTPWLMADVGSFKSFALFLLPILSTPVWGDTCRIQRASEVAALERHLDGVGMLVSVCPHCSNTNPVPLRVRTYELVHTTPEMVTLAFYDLTFPVGDLERAEQTGEGPLGDALRAAIEKEYENETGYLPNDPILIQEKRDRYEMMLRFTREELAMRTWVDLTINGEPVNVSLLYFPVGDEQYKSLGAAVGCELYENAPLKVKYTPVNRDPALESPPERYVVDVTGQCYDGSCPQAKWTVAAATDYYDEMDGEVVGTLPVDETLEPLQTLSHVKAGRARATRDHGRIFEGDVFYLLDSLGEGFYRFWHYGDVFVDDTSDIKRPRGWNYCDEKHNCWAELETHPESIWWSKVVRANGDEIWITEPLSTIRGVLGE